MLQFHDVHYTYRNGAHVLKGVSLTIERGKKYALIGKNGCGKTTWLLHTNGIYRPTKGEVYWEGKRVKEHLRQHVGVVFQNPEHQFLAPTIEEELALSLQGNSERIERAIKTFSLAEWRDVPIHHLSLGQKKWLSLAVAMASQPELLIVDEPAAYLDAAQSERLIMKLNEWHEAGTTLVVITHDFDFVWQWADEVFVMDDGRIVLHGTPAFIFSQADIFHQLRLPLPLLLRIWMKENKTCTEQQLFEWIERWKKG
ncbi:MULTISPECIES: energy-coupling factor ABC transporter ATP-binding protein [Anoxybacillus]|uniref:ABC transporter ATP-binding protein n=1 Tax=Anoxybacillus flavithermus TaxID=33934 RepID=A0A178TD47_9BACL|nr:ABC transporter ATP-binding protein [Anoxybacillus flavithermus]ASA96612.1 ABC transporter ATP-binding protein [Anoxybacillus flavithermus]ELK21115.1 cobalt ABC transporter ATPase [Anoxybacillus flavithermus TNO-09.006]MBE2906960.1 ABC transporter ATP-binding protein [Anoxybacillus flavithermus]MBE2909796.1 ABC transporter ATP-binding protein [Anoxybacillus flavithermus]MBE2912593.1 ABC transporter ATP-binding protein [Anoxybacillus flavithermus]